MIKKGSISLSRDGGSIIRFSNSLEEILGFSQKDVAGKGFTFLSPEDLASEHSSLIASIGFSGPVTGRPTRLRHKDGSIVEVYISVFPLKDRTGGIYSIIIIVSTETQPSVPAILSDEFQRMFRFSNDSVAVTDKDGNIIDVNNSFLLTYGYAREEVLGKNPRILKSSHSTKELYERMWADIMDPQKGYWRGEIINLNRSGQEVPVILSVNAIKDSSGEITNFLGIAFNIADQKELERVNRMYIDYIIHDLRSPLTVIMANAELLGMQMPGVAEGVRKKIDRIRESSEKINRMASDILEFSRTRHGGALRRESARLGSIIKDAIQPFEKSDKKLFVNGVPAQEAALFDAEIFADADKIQRIIYNLLNNAFKYASREARLDYALSGGSILIQVSNDGRRISPSDTERIFDAFYQTSDGIKTGGAGLGLNIVKTFAEAHGGKVWAEPGVENGAVFSVLIPVGEKAG